MLSELKKHKLSISLVIIFSFCISACIIGESLILKDFINSLQSSNIKSLFFIILSLIFLILIQLFLKFISIILTHKTSIILGNNIRMSFYKTVEKASKTAIQLLTTGKIVNTLASQTGNVSFKLISSVTGIIQSALIWIICSISIIILSPYLGFILTIVSALGTLINLYLSNYQSNKTAKCEIALANTSEVYEEIISKREQLILSRMINPIQKILEKRHREVFKTSCELANTNAIAHFANSFFQNIIVFIVIAIGSWNYLRGYGKISELISFLPFIPYVSMPVKIIQEHLNRLSLIKGANFSIIENKKVLENLKNELNLTYQMYVTSNQIIQLNQIKLIIGEKELLKNATITSKIGEPLILVGESGCGKSSFLKELSAQNDFCYISQTPFIINGTIKENIKLQNVELSLEKIEKKLTELDISSFINSLEEKFNTKVGDEGHKLSGGQMQILCAIRLLFNKRTCFLIDEPTSATDMHSKKIIAKIIKEKSKESQIIISTHDLDFIQLLHSIIPIKIIKMDSYLLTEYNLNEITSNLI